MREWLAAGDWLLPLPLAAVRHASQRQDGTKRAANTALVTAQNRSEGCARSPSALHSLTALCNLATSFTRCAVPRTAKVRSTRLEHTHTWRDGHALC